MSRSPRRATAKPTFVVDNREQTPFCFAGLDWSGERIGPQRVVSGTLATGDYSIAGMEDRISLERKSHDDLFHSLTFGRSRLLALIERARSFGFFAFVVEADLAKIAQGHPRHRRLTGQTAVRTLMSWQVKFPWVHWWLCPHRDHAALTALRLLERFSMVEPDREGGEPVVNTVGAKNAVAGHVWSTMP